MKLSDFVEINPSAKLTKGKEYPCVMMNEITPGSRYVNGENKKAYKGGSRFEKGDVLFARITPCLENGKIAQFMGEGVGFGSTEYFIFREKNGVSDQSYIFYLACLDIIRKPAEKSMFGASGRQRADLDVVKDVEVPAPPLPVQRKIAAVLSAYDNLIEVNTRRIRILEEMAQAVYHEWFGSVDSRGEAVSLPDGWEVKTFSDVCNQIIDGDWIETKDQGGDNYRLLQVSNIGLGEFVETGNFRYITQETFERLNCQEIVPGDILVSRMPTPIGRGWLVTEMPWRMITAVDVAIIRPNPELLNPYYCVYWLNSPETLARSEMNASGTTRPRITRRVLSGFDLIVPPIELQNEFGKIAGNSYEMQTVLRRQNTNLRRTRDLLLPRLVGGKIDVSEMEIVTGER
jgi:type I restriction enzyme S subunit